MKQSATPRLSYKAHIDGLRALAVSAVLFYHANLGFPGGYVGVDVFFVISGYLITGLILKDLDAGDFRILNFWERRVRRILPALAVVVLTCLASGYLVLLPNDFDELGQSVAAQTMMASNVFFYMQSGYFDQDAQSKPLLHTWSLAVEEQFYLIFPFLLIMLIRFLRERIASALVLLCIASFLLCVWWSYSHVWANFYFLPTRAWELLIGAVLAASPMTRKSAQWQAEILSVCGIFAIVIAMLFYDHETQFPGVAALLPVVGAAAFIYFNSYNTTFIGKVLASTPFVFVGLISYSLYLWHWPVLVFAKYWAIGTTPQISNAWLFVPIILFAVFSWKFIETPFRKRCFLKSRSRIFAFAGLTSTVLLFAGVTIHEFNGLPSRLSPSALKYLKGSNESENVFMQGLAFEDAMKGNLVELGSGNIQSPIVLLVWGDSHAMAAMPVLDTLCKEYRIRGVAATHIATVPFVGYESQNKASLKSKSVAFNNAVAEFILSKHVSDVVLILRLDSYVDADNGTSRLRSGLIDTIKAIHPSGARIWIMKQVPKHSWNVPQALAVAEMQGRSVDSLASPLELHQKMQQLSDPIFEGIESDFDRVTILDPTSLYLTGSEKTCRIEDAGIPLYRDDDHLSVAGAMLLRPLFVPIFEGLSKRPPTALIMDASQ